MGTRDSADSSLGELISAQKKSLFVRFCAALMAAASVFFSRQ
jgi:hypothetical protein